MTTKEDQSDAVKISADAKSHGSSRMDRGPQLAQMYLGKLDTIGEGQPYGLKKCHFDSITNPKLYDYTASSVIW